jgi:hypothetical protein
LLWNDNAGETLMTNDDIVERVITDLRSERTATDWIAYLEAEPRSEPHLSIAAVLREQVIMLQRAHSIISIREAAHPSAKGRAWLAQYELTGDNSPPCCGGVDTPTGYVHTSSCKP